MILGLFSGVFTIFFGIVIITGLCHKEYNPNYIIIFIISIVILTTTIFCSCIPSLQSKPIATEQEIVSVQDDSQVNGSFSMFSGAINEDYYFGYYYKSGVGYKLEKVKSDNTIIIETNEITPKIVKTIKDVNFWQLLILWNFNCYSEENIIYVPVGTIIKDFNLNGGK